MAHTYSLQDFDHEYLQRLKDGLLPRLQKYPGWVEVERLTDDTVAFVEAVVVLIRNGYFEDYCGHQRVEIGAGDQCVRYIPDFEIAMIEQLKHEKGDTLH